MPNDLTPAEREEIEDVLANCATECYLSAAKAEKEER